MSTAAGARATVGLNGGLTLFLYANESAGRTGSFMIRSIALLGLWALIVLGGCADNRPTFGVVSGDVAYDRAALPPDAELEVRLYDLSRGGEGGTLVAQHRAKASSADGRAPFAVRYDPGMIDPAHTYAIRAMVASENEPILVTRKAYPVLTHGHPTRVKLMLEPTERAVVRPDGPVELIPAYRERAAD
jgi:putative lipoprotein